MGDAISSFLKDEDMTTRLKCLSSKKSLSTIADWRESSMPHLTTSPRRWFSAASWRRWLLTLCS